MSLLQQTVADWLDKATAKFKELLDSGSSQASGWVDQARTSAEGLIDKVKK